MLRTKTIYYKIIKSRDFKTTIKKITFIEIIMLSKLSQIKQFAMTDPVLENGKSLRHLQTMVYMASFLQSGYLVSYLT